MSLIKEEQQKQIKDLFKKLEGNVKLVFFTQEMECPFCSQARELIQDVTSLSDGKITLEIYDFVADKDKVEMYKIDKIPAIVIEGQKDYGIRLFGIPAGYEFTSFMSSIMMVSKGDPGLTDETKEALSKLKEPVHIRVFTTLTCPYCPKAVEMSHKLAMGSDLITAEMIESTEFPTLVQKYNVMSVPRVIINDKVDFEGALPEKEFVENLMKLTEIGPETETEKQRIVAVIGASSDRNKFGNKAVRAYSTKGYKVYPVNPYEEIVEGLKSYRSILDIPEEIDCVTVYVPPKVGMTIIEDIAKKGVKELYFNPGAESDELVEKAQKLGLKPILACSILAIGLEPNDFN